MVRKSGQKAVFEVNVKGLHPEIIKLIGRLQYRYSYGENVLQHSIEVGIISGMLASQLNINIQNSKMAGFLHDIGKALTHEVEGSHAVIGADIVKKYGVREPIITAIKEHHDTRMSTVESFVVAAADAISAARPGARHDTLEAYVERLEKLENVASEFEGVEKVFAIQAGREVRVMVNPENVDDVFHKLSKESVDGAVFGLTDTGYENLSLNIAAIRKLVQQQQAIIIAYEQYYKNQDAVIKEHNKQFD